MNWSTMSVTSLARPTEKSDTRRRAILFVVSAPDADLPAVVPGGRATSASFLKLTRLSPSSRWRGRRRGRQSSRVVIRGDDYQSRDTIESEGVYLLLSRGRRNWLEIRDKSSPPAAMGRIPLSDETAVLAYLCTSNILFLLLFFSPWR